MESKRLETRLGPLAWRSSGHGPTLVFFAGALANGDLWRDVVAALEDRYRCITVDLPLGAHTSPLSAGADRSALSLADLVHPPAAVCGTPTETALELIRELEHMERGRYAGPVGWVDAQGNGEFGIALRCAELTGSRARLFAGCGIVAGSDPVAEVAETEVKFLPMRQSLEG